MQIDNYGRLRVSGERPLEGGQWSRFRKEFQVPEGCDAGGIRARLEKDGVLHVIMPRLTPLDDEPKAAADHEAEAARHAAAAADETKRHEEMEEERARKRHAGDEDDHASDEGEGARHQAASTGGQAYGFARDRSRSGMVRALLLAVAVALVGVAGLYARYRWMDPSTEAAPADGAIGGLSDY